MPIQLPRLGGAYLSSLIATFSVPKHDTSELPKDLKARIDGDNWLFLEIEPGQDEHSVFIGMGPGAPFGDGPEQVELEEPLQQLHPYLRHETTDVWMRGSYHIPQEEVPDRGIVAAMLGVAVKVGSRSLTMTGATLSVDDDSFNEISWTLLSNGSLSVSIHGVKTFKLDEQFLVNIETQLQQCFRQLVLGESEGGTSES